MSMCCVCVEIRHLFHTYVIENIDSTLIFVCLINDYSLIVDLHIFAYGRAECASISLKCTKVKLLILNYLVCDSKSYRSYHFCYFLYFLFIVSYIAMTAIVEQSEKR